MLKVRFIIARIVIAGPIFVLVKSFEGDYEISHQHQSDWPGNCQTGESQSPINIDTSKTDKRRTLGESLIVHGYQKNLDADLKNNGHTISVTIRDPDALKNIWVQDGGLSLSKNVFYAAHFHWGLNNSKGSEHTIDGKAYPMEAHLVHWNKDIGENITDAKQKLTRISLHVLGVHFKIGKMSQSLEHIFQRIKGMRHNQFLPLAKQIQLKHLLPNNKQAFYRYEGSLTTPSKITKSANGNSETGCHEIVKWTVFKEPIEISQKQMDIMRTATHQPHEDINKTEPVGNNFRETKPVNERTVLDVDMLDDDILDDCEHDTCDPDDDDDQGGDKKQAEEDDDYEDAEGHDKKFLLIRVAK